MGWRPQFGGVWVVVDRHPGELLEDLQLANTERNIDKNVQVGYLFGNIQFDGKITEVRRRLWISVVDAGLRVKEAMMRVYSCT